METIHIQTGDTERITVIALDILRAPITGLVNLLCTIQRVSDGQWFDFADLRFKAAGWTERQHGMIETDAVLAPGMYHYDLVTATIVNPAVDDSYHFTIGQSPPGAVANMPQIGGIRISQIAYTVKQSFVYDRNAAVVTGNIWVERGGLVVSNPTSLTCACYNADGAVMFTVVDLAPDANGVFKVMRLNPGFVSNRSYYVLTTILGPWSTITAAKGLITVG